MTSIVSRLPKDIQRNIVQFLSTPTADIVSRTIEQLLQQFCSLTSGERGKVDRHVNIQIILKMKSFELFSGTTRPLTRHISWCKDLHPTFQHSRSEKTLDNYGIITNFYKAEHHPNHYKNIYKKFLTDYLDTNQVSYKKGTHLKTLSKLIMGIPNTEEKYKTIKTKKPKTIKKKLKLILV